MGKKKEKRNKKDDDNKWHGKYLKKRIIGIRKGKKKQPKNDEEIANV